MTARRAVWVLVGVVAIAAVVVLATRSGPSTSPRARADRLAHELACPVCTGESVAESNAPESVAMRSDIHDRIAAGQSDRAIRDAFVRTYGERILLTPSNGGLGVIAWGLPLVVIFLGAIGIAFALRRWGRTPKLSATAEDEAIVARARGGLES